MGWSEKRLEVVCKQMNKIYIYVHHDEQRHGYEEVVRIPCPHWKWAICILKGYIESGFKFIDVDRSKIVDHIYDIKPTRGEKGIHIWVRHHEGKYHPEKIKQLFRQRIAESLDKYDGNTSLAALVMTGAISETEV